MPTVKPLRFVLSLLVFLALGNSIQCVTQFDPELTKDITKLVVDGLITDQPPPYQIRVTYRAPYTNDVTIFGRSPAQAKISIRDDQGGIEELRYTSNGYFISSATGMRGVVGRKYFVSIVLPDGRQYQSREELLKPTPKIDALRAEFQQLTGIYLRGKFKISVETTDPADSEDFYRWSWSHFETKEVCKVTLTFPDYTKIYWSCCVPCWTVIRCEGCINIASDKLINGRKFVDQFLVDVPYTSAEPYFVLAQQQSLTKEAYNFWNKVRGQLNNSGGVFDTPPVLIQGNIYNVSNQDEQVLGYFGASSIRYMPYYVDRLVTGVPPFRHVKFGGNTIPCKPCVESYLTTSFRPLGWVD